MTVVENRESFHLSPVMTRITDLVIDHARGARFWTKDGEEYLDFVSGVAVNALGHSHPEVVEAIQKQARQLIHFGLNYGYYESALLLAEKIAQIAPGDLDTVFFSNSGGEAIDGAIKLARAATGRTGIIAFEGSFHGRTIGATSITASSSKYRKQYEPLMGGVYHIPYPYPKRLGVQTEEEATQYSLQKLVECFELKVDPSQVAAVVVEPVLGEGGYVPAPIPFLKELRRITQEHGILLIADEVQTGFGRTGKMFAVEHAAITPDILVLAKALAAGMPLGAIVANRKLHERWQVGGHGSTFGGNPISCAAAFTSIRVIERDRLVERSAQLGQEIRSRLHERIGDLPFVAQIRGKGLMIGIEFEKPELVESVKQEALRRRLLITSCGVKGQTIRLMLPLNIEANDLDEGLTILEESMKTIMTK